jgi:hypothetical protein
MSTEDWMADDASLKIMMVPDKSGSVVQSDWELALREEPATRVERQLDVQAGTPVVEQAHGGSIVQPPPELITIERTPHLDVIGQLPLRAGNSFSIDVFVDRAPPHTGEVSSPFHAQVPAATQALDVEVSLDGSAHFTFPEGRERVMTIFVDQSKSAEVSFKVAVKKELKSLAGARLAAYFTFEGRPSGQVIVDIPLTDEPAGTQETPPAGEVPPPPIVRASPPNGVPPAMSLRPGLRKPDLIVEVTDPVRDMRSLRCKLQSPHAEELGIETARRSWRLATRADDLVQSLFAEFTQRSIPPIKRLNSLRGAGHAIWDAAPKHLQDAIWKLIDGGRLHSILVVSADPYFPWELMIASRTKNGQREEREPLGVECAVARWIAKDNTSPPQKVPLTRSLVIAPDYKGPPRPNPLAHAASEAKTVCATVPGYLLVPAEYLKVSASLFASQSDLVHFACHGVASGNIGIQELALEDLEMSSIEVAGLVRPRIPDTPFIFLNACEVGRPAPALDGVGGFASAFIGQGAKAVIAPLWSVEDTVAASVAQEFYDRLKAQPQTPYAEIIRDIRSHAYNGSTQGVDTYAAYCFYGDPLASSA